MENYLNRDDAPFSERVWAAIDAAVVGAAKEQITARRILAVEGPYGLGMKGLPGRDTPLEGEAVSDSVQISGSVAPPVALITSGFKLSARDIAAFESTGVGLNLGPVATASIGCAHQEDDLIFNGSKGLRVEGLLHAKGVQSLKLKVWTDVGAAADSVMEALNKLDAAGFHGPHALALAPDRYNLLFRRYAQGEMLEMDHLRQVAASGVVKAPALPAGTGVLLATGPQYVSIVLGQDLMAGFVGPDGRDFEFTISESVALRLLQPEAVCVLK